MTAGVELRVGLTTHNDAKLLPLCLESLARTLETVPHEVVVIDDRSDDGTPEIARAAGARVEPRQLGQADALNYLLATSKAHFTLLIHSDVTLLADDWYPRVRQCISDDIVLVSPEDSGLGPMLRAAYGTGKPESSFMFWSTAGAQRLRRLGPRHLLRVARERIPFVRYMNLYHRHITHYLPAELERAGLRWKQMAVLPSPTGAQWFDFDADGSGATWQAKWGSLEYGFGNFYALDGEITHFHQWYGRDTHDDVDALNADGVPLRFLREAASRFERDYHAGRVHLPATRAEAFQAVERGG
jgi:glycosyltransferase involved in cell wall biosynthesis